MRGTWYSGWVGWASEAGIVLGFEDGTFAPDRPITRAEMAAIITRYIDYINLRFTRYIDAPKRFTDADEIASWAKSYIETMRRVGIIRGNADGSFNPDGKLTRAEAATVIERMDKAIGYLKIEEPKSLDFKSDSGDFYLVGAWDLYYSGTALLTSYPGVSVKTNDGELPSLVCDGEGRTYGTQLSFGSGTYVGLDLRILNIDPSEYPVLRIGVSSASDFEVSAYIAGADVPLPASGEGGCVQVDLTDVFGDTDQQPVMIRTRGGDIALTYAAAFRTETDAATFDIMSYKDELSSFDGESVAYLPEDTALTERYMNETDARIREIRESADAVSADEILSAGGVCYYVSSVHGDDSNDGLSQDTPWRTTENLYKVRAGGQVITSVAKPGDAVLFERGSVFNQSIEGEINYLTVYMGVSYGAYGSGEKPIITAYVPLEGGVGSWSKTEYPNVWRLDADMSGIEDIGNAVFTHGDTTLWGVKIIPSDPEDPFREGSMTSELGCVSNGRDYYVSESREMRSPGALEHELEFFHDTANGKFYLYCAEGDPAAVFGDIKLSPRTDLAAVEYVTTKDPTLVDNLSFMYGGGIGLETGCLRGSFDVTVQNCVFEWIGGSIQDGTVRFGNAIQNWGSCDGLFVRDCYINQIYDAGFTSQGSGVMVDIYFENNVTERCGFSVEFFNSAVEGRDEYIFENVFIRNNISRYAGYGFGHTRPDKQGTFFRGSKSWEGDVPTYNMVHENNINLYCAIAAFSSGGLARGAHAQGVITRGNVYLLNNISANVLRSRTDIEAESGDNKVMYPYTEQYIRYLAQLGIEEGSTFYYCDYYLYPEAEEAGAYR